MAKTPALPSTADLPGDLGQHQRLVETVGLEGVLRLCAAHGGAGFYVPATLDRCHYLAHLLGHEATAALVDEFAGEALHIPSLSSFSAIRAASVCAVFRQSGLSVGEISYLMDISHEEARRLARAGAKYSPKLRLGDMLRSVRLLMVGMNTAIKPATNPTEEDAEE